MKPFAFSTHKPSGNSLSPLFLACCLFRVWLPPQRQFSFLSLKTTLRLLSLLISMWIYRTDCLGGWIRHHRPFWNALKLYKTKTMTSGWNSTYITIYTQATPVFWVCVSREWLTRRVSKHTHTWRTRRWAQVGRPPRRFGFSSFWAEHF
jgi:hypothetical protein